MSTPQFWIPSRPTFFNPSSSKAATPASEWNLEPQPGTSTQGRLLARWPGSSSTLVPGTRFCQFSATPTPWPAST
ncbi:hypothetical protein ACFX2F_005600 [Malus domestica]